MTPLRTIALSGGLGKASNVSVIALDGDERKFDPPLVVNAGDHVAWDHGKVAVITAHEFESFQAGTFDLPADRWRTPL